MGSLLVRLPFETQITTAKGPWREMVMKKARADMMTMDSVKAMSKADQDARFEQWCSNTNYMFKLTERVMKQVGR